MPNKLRTRDKFEVNPHPDSDISLLNEPTTTNTQSDKNKNGGDGTGHDVIGTLAHDLEPRDDRFRCGYFRWQPDWLQRCNNPRMLLAAICWFTFTQGFVCYGIVMVNLVAWERLFELRSRQTAWIVSMQDVSAAFSMFLVGYLGQSVHNGRILAMAALIMACGSITMLLPHFLSGPYELGPMPVQTCNLHNNITPSLDCNTEESSSGYYWFLVIGHALHGIGGSAVFTIAIPYLDTQIKSRDSPLYIGIMHAISALGPTAGYIIGGVFLGFYVDYGRDVGEIDLDPSDPRWVGAWWIGLMFSSLASLTAIIACFPRELPSARIHKEDKSVDAYRNKKHFDHKDPSGGEFCIDCQEHRNEQSACVN